MLRFTLHAAALAATLSAVLAGSAAAHVTVEAGEASPGSYYKAVLRVPHGCQGSATLKVRVQIPEGAIAVKPMPKPGWTVTTLSGTYARTYSNHGASVSEGVKEVAWSGRLLDAHYDEFVFRAYLSPDLQAGTTLHFPIVQECEQGVERWIEIPAAGKSPDDYKSPAPGVRLVTGK